MFYEDLEKSLASIADAYKKMKSQETVEELHGDQHKLDANKNGKLDAEDFEMLRDKKDEK